jgi:hypothetical protein
MALLVFAGVLRGYMDMIGMRKTCPILKEGVKINDE